MIKKDKIQAIQKYFSTQEEAVAVYLYGSYARGTNNALSDIDIAVMVDRDDEKTSQRQLDYIEATMSIFNTDNVDVQMLTSQTPPAVALRMIKGQVVYCNDEKKKALIEAEILSRYQDFYPFLHYQIEQMEKRLAEGRYASRC